MSDRQQCEPANSIIEKLGGLTAVARVLDVAPQTVMRWRWSRERRGTGGIVPHWHVPKLLDHAKGNRIELAPADFLPTPEVRAG